MTTPTPGQDATRRRAEEYLANRIFSLQWKKCEAHSHTLCSVCAADWIVKDKADAVAQAMREREEGRDA